MVATTATTPSVYATGCLPASAPPPPRSPTFDDSTPNTLASLLPPPTLTDEILDDLAVPQFSLAIVAQKHGLTLSGMLTWLNLPETREVLALRESAAYAHARHVAALNIGHPVETVASIVRDYNTTRPEREAQDRKTPGFAHRAATNARKAAWLLLQFARIVPVNESDLSRARDASRTASPRVARPLEEQACSESASAKNHATGCLSASANNTTSTPSRAHRTTHVSERMSSSPVPSKSASDFDALLVLAPASSPQADAGSPHGCASAAMPPDQSASSLPSQRVHPAGVLPDLPPASALEAEADSPPASALEAEADSPPASALKHSAGHPIDPCPDSSLCHTPPSASAAVLDLCAPVPRARDPEW